MAIPLIGQQNAPLTQNPDSAELDFSSFNGRKQHDKIVAQVKSDYDKAKSARSAVERQWYLNLCFFYGKQNVAVQSISGATAGGTRLVTPNAPYWRSRPVINKIRPTIRTELAKVTSQKPNVSVLPSSSDDADLFAAQAGEQIWDSFYRQKRVNNVLRRAMWWTLICGNGYVKDWWDKNTIDKISDQYGDICIRPETPFHVFIPDLREEEIENQPWVIHASTKSVDWVKLHYTEGLDGKEIKPNVKSANDIVQDSFLNIVGNASTTPDSVLILEAWIKPGGSAMFPDGALITLVGDQIVQAHQGWPYAHGEYPFTKFDHIPSGKYYSTSVIEDMIPLQKEYNRTRGQIIEAKNRMAKPQLIAPQGSINPAQITSEPGQVILYKQGFTPPAPLPLQPLPSYVLEEQDRIQSDLDDISGQHEVSKGSAPAGVTAATAISFLQEQDDTKLSHTVTSIEEGVEKLGHHVLSHVVQYWDVPRMVKVVGEDGSFDSLMLSNADLKENTDLKVEGGSALPTSKAAKQAFIMDLMKMGFINPDKGLEVMEIGGVQKLYDQLQVDIRQAQRENLKMRSITPDIIMQHDQSSNQQGIDPSTGGPMLDPNTGQPMEVIAPPIVPVNTWDEHRIHIDTHNKFRKSQNFEKLDQEIKDLFEEHVQLHVQAMAVAMTPTMGADGQPTDPTAPTVEGGNPASQGQESTGQPNQFSGLPPADSGA